jgi:glycyl-radical enzyme activating protein
VEQIKGLIFNIQHFSIHDGPGVRTAVFFKGCNLHCLWCHNPESISNKIQVVFYPEKCIGCGKCYINCKHARHTLKDGKHLFDPSGCVRCLECCNSCYAEALVGIGKNVTVDQLMEYILTDKLYYCNTGGGVTFTGGECMMQPDFLAEVLHKCRDNNIHTAVDTAGNVPFSLFDRMIDDIDLFLYDIKAFDSELHKKLTGAGNELILENLSKLSKYGKQIIVRIPYIPGLNDKEISKIADFLFELNIFKVEILGFHRLGETKYTALGCDNPTKNIVLPSKAELKEASEYFSKKSIPVSF